MPGREKPPNESPEGSIRSSVRLRVLFGLAAIMAIFSCLTIYSIVLHKRTVEQIGLINSAYLPLILGTSEISANQLVFNVFIDRLVDDPNQSVTREWIDAARRVRPPTVNRLVNLIDDILKTDIPEEEADTKRHCTLTRLPYLLYLPLVHDGKGGVPTQVGLSRTTTANGGRK